MKKKKTKKENEISTSKIMKTQKVGWKRRKYCDMGQQR